MYVDDFAKQLTRDLQLPQPLTAGEDGAYWMGVGDELTVALRPHGEGIAFTVTVGHVPELDMLETFYLTLLLANLFGQGTDSSVLGLDQEGKEVVLSRTLPKPLHYLECREQLEEFFNTADFWVDELKDPERLLKRLVA